MKVHITGPPQLSQSSGNRSESVPNAHTFRPWGTRHPASTAEHQRRRASHRRTEHMREEREREWLRLEVEKRRTVRGEQCLAELANAVAASLSLEFASLSSEFHATVADGQPEAGCATQRRDNK
jgi:hypothetical protein